MYDMGARIGMLVVETIAKIRRAYFVQQKPIKVICPWRGAAPMLAAPRQSERWLGLAGSAGVAN
jgi:hypothetical protein